MVSLEVFKSIPADGGVGGHNPVNLQFLNNLKGFIQLFVVQIRRYFQKDRLLLIHLLPDLKDPAQDRFQGFLVLQFVQVCDVGTAYIHYKIVNTMIDGPEYRLIVGHSILVGGKGVLSNVSS